jgi:hypothetical protein
LRIEERKAGGWRLEGLNIEHPTSNIQVVRSAEAEGF